MWAISGEDHLLGIDFLAEGEYIIPTAAWITVRGPTGSVLLQDAPLDVSSTQTTFSIPAVNNTLSGGTEFENRFTTVVFNYGGRPYRIEDSYRVADFIPISTSPNQVRSVLGLDGSELLDRDVDLLLSYLTLKEEYGQDFTDALTAGGLKTLKANEAIALKAALQVVPSLNFRAGTKWSSEESQFQRKGDFSIEEIEKDLSMRLSIALSVVLDQELTTFDAFSLATPTDVITGE